MKLLKIFLTGFWVLIFALVANFLAIRFDINTWYGFVSSVGKVGLVAAFINQKAVDIIFLFIIYPFILGLPGWIYFKVLNNN